MEKIIIQPDLCDGCHDCQEACSRLHGASGILVREVEGSFYPIICQQCEDAPCQLICPTEAMTEKGIEVVKVGDCDEVSDISDAIKTAYDAANAL